MQHAEQADVRNRPICSHEVKHLLHGGKTKSAIIGAAPLCPLALFIQRGTLRYAYRCCLNVDLKVKDLSLEKLRASHRDFTI
ncbi:hypothetical protein EYF80_039534 [Liparis tanakae]|uniref:Uncharacterized protein n=1 Tax=Liparis tanakae TaxID=230148 RepID=A0A4Z2G9R8_9TELE|nr:hypothetical protein EYF80_039534 [Liparis tanakae]